MLRGVSGRVPRKTLVTDSTSSDLSAARRTHLLTINRAREKPISRDNPRPRNVVLPADVLTRISEPAPPNRSWINHSDATRNRLKKVPGSLAQVRRRRWRILVRAVHALPRSRCGDPTDFNNLSFAAHNGSLRMRAYYATAAATTITTRTYLFIKKQCDSSPAFARPSVFS